MKERRILIMPGVRDKPFKVMPKCAHCGKSRNQHQGGTGRCPIGKKPYKRYAQTTFVKRH